MSTTTEKILQTFSSKLASGHKSGKDFRVFYKNGGDVVNVLTLVDNDENEKLLNDVYKAQAQILRKFVINKKDNPLTIDFRVVPKYNSSIGSLVPDNFKRYNATT